MRLPKSKEKLKTLRESLEQKISEINKALFEIEKIEHKECQRCNGSLKYWDRGIYDSDSGWSRCYHVLSKENIKILK